MSAILRLLKSELSRLPNRSRSTLSTTHRQRSQMVSSTTLQNTSWRETTMHWLHHRLEKHWKSGVTCRSQLGRLPLQVFPLTFNRPHSLKCSAISPRQAVLCQKATVTCDHEFSLFPCFRHFRRLLRLQPYCSRLDDISTRESSRVTKHCSHLDWEVLEEASAGQAANDESEGPLGGRDGLIEIRERLEELLGAYEGDDGDKSEDERPRHR